MMMVSMEGVGGSSSSASDGDHVSTSHNEDRKSPNKSAVELSEKVVTIQDDDGQGPGENARDGGISPQEHIHGPGDNDGILEGSENQPKVFQPYTPDRSQGAATPPDDDDENDAEDVEVGDLKLS